MEKKDKIRVARKALMKISEGIYEGYQMCMAMDGSGDCGTMISEYYQKLEKENQKKIFNQLDL